LYYAELKYSVYFSVLHAIIRFVRLPALNKSGIARRKYTFSLTILRLRTHNAGITGWLNEVKIESAHQEHQLLDEIPGPKLSNHLSTQQAQFCRWLV